MPQKCETSNQKKTQEKKKDAQEFVPFSVMHPMKSCRALTTPPPPLFLSTLSKVSDLTDQGRGGVERERIYWFLELKKKAGRRQAAGGRPGPPSCLS